MDLKSMKITTLFQASYVLVSVPSCELMRGT